jgi:hypothetical protein
VLLKDRLEGAKAQLAITHLGRAAHVVWLCIHQHITPC